MPGPSLDQVVAENGPLPEPALWPLLAGLTEAMAAIHACGVVHRDLKPANVLLATDGPRVIDFGISRATDGTVLTAAGVVFGTPGYMSPEQAEGKPAGPASDMFALGCVIAYAATGAGPFGTGTAAAVLYRVVHAEAALDGVPPALREILSGCLAKDPAARPTPAALAAAVAGRDHGTGPSAVAFWPRPVANVIGAYQARLEQETQGSRPTRRSSRGPARRITVTTPATRRGPGQAAGHGQGCSGPAGAGAAGADGARVPRRGGRRSRRCRARGERRAIPRATHSHRGIRSQRVTQQPQGYPGPQGYSSSQGYPQPQGYNGRQGPAAPPRGYSPNAQPAGYPQPYQVGRVPLGPLPASMRNAIGLMYAGAAYTLVYAIGVVAVASAIIAKHPAETAARASSGHVTVGGVAALTVFLSLIEIALWLGLARACRRGKGWARVTGTVLFGLHTLGFLGVLVNSHPGLGPAKLLTTLSWLIACGAVVFLWQRPSSLFFRTAAAPGRPA